MKIIFTFAAALFISINGLAQNGINYKALIKDSNNNSVANTSVQVSLDILKGTDIVYTETHFPTSDANGIILFNIGEGFAQTDGNFSDIDWGSDDHFLNLDINIGDGWVDMGTTQFKVVPYAIHAQNVSNPVTKINDLSDGKSDDDGTQDGSSIFIGMGSGTSDDGTDNRNVALGYLTLPINTSGRANTAIGHVALNANTIGENNSAMGYFALVSNTEGNGNTASGSFSLTENSSGLWNTAAGYLSLGSNETGNYNTANGYRSLQNSLNGSFNTASGGQSMQDNTSGNNNTAFGYGAGQRVDGSNNTFLGYNAGSAPGFTVRPISGSVFIGNEAGYNETLNNKLYIDNSSTTDPLIYGDFNTDLLRINGRMEVKTTSTSSNPLRLETNSIINFMTYNTSNGYIGYSGVFNGINDMDFGTGSGNLNGKVHLVTNAAPRLTVDSNGDVGIGTEDPSSKLHVVGTGRITGTLNVGDIWVGSFGNLSSAFSNSTSRISSSTNFTPTSEFSYTLGLPDRRWLSVYSHNGTINTSDRRDKTNITALDYGLKEIMELDPVSFTWKQMPHEGNKLGLIAQDLLNVIPEVVHTHSWVNNSEENSNKKRIKADRMGVYYSDLIPVLIKAMQEQQIMINDLKAEILKLKN